MGSKQQGRFVAFSLGFRLVVISGLAGAIEPGSFRAGTRAWKARSSTVVQAFRVERIVIKGFLSLDYCFANCSAIREKMKIGD